MTLFDVIDKIWVNFATKQNDSENTNSLDFNLNQNIPDEE